MEHKIEDTAKVYLLWDCEDGAWYVDPLTTDGGALDGSEDGPYIMCENMDDEDVAGHGDQLPNDECIRVASQAMAAPMPNAVELLRMLTEALALQGYTPTYMSRGQIAKYAGVSRDTAAGYKLPTPDAEVGGVPGWRKETVDRWLSQRPRNPRTMP